MQRDPLSLETLLRPVVEGLGLELWGLDYQASKGHARLCIYIDHAEGVSIDHCARVSEQVSAVLDVEDPIKLPYTLEVSSPGVDRPLFNREQLLRYQGCEVRIRMEWPVQGRRHFTGTVDGVDAEQVTIVLEQARVALPLDAIASARLIPKRA